MSTLDLVEPDPHGLAARLQDTDGRGRDRLGELPALVERRPDSSSTVMFGIRSSTGSGRHP